VLSTTSLIPPALGLVSRSIALATAARSIYLSQVAIAIKLGHAAFLVFESGSKGKGRETEKGWYDFVGEMHDGLSIIPFISIQLLRRREKEKGE
jgi:hypothetical protein